MNQHLWVVELWTDLLPDPRWVPTFGVALTQRAGREELTRWQQQSPGSTYRLTKYVPVRP